MFNKNSLNKPKWLSSDVYTALKVRGLDNVPFPIIEDLLAQKLKTRWLLRYTELLLSLFTFTGIYAVLKTMNFSVYKVISIIILSLLLVLIEYIYRKSIICFIKNTIHSGALDELKTLTDYEIIYVDDPGLLIKAFRIIKNKFLSR